MFLDKKSIHDFPPSCFVINFQRYIGLPR